MKESKETQDEAQTGADVGSSDLLAGGVTKHLFQRQLDEITGGYLLLADKIAETEPERAKKIREHVAAARVHYAELEAVLIQHFGGWWKEAS